MLMNLSDSGEGTDCIHGLNGPLGKDRVLLDQLPDLLVMSVLERGNELKPLVDRHIPMLPARFRFKMRRGHRNTTVFRCQT